MMRQANEQEAFILSMRPKIERIARAIARQWEYSWVDYEDLMQEGLAEICKEIRRADQGKVRSQSSLTLYLTKCAMFDYLTSSRKSPVISLDAYLTYKDGETREIADRPTVNDETDTRERRRILAALNQLKERERLVLMAHFQIDRRAVGLTPDEVQQKYSIDENRYYYARKRGLQKLAAILA